MAGREPKGPVRSGSGDQQGDSLSRLWTGFGFQSSFTEAGACGLGENKENMSDSGNKELGEKAGEEVDCNASLQLRLDDTMDEEGGSTRNGSMEAHVSLDDSPMVAEEQSGECSEKPFGSEQSAEAAAARTFDDSVIEIIEDSPVAKNHNRSIIDLMDSREDLKLEMSDSPTSATKANRRQQEESPMSEILASNSLLYENVDNINKVIDDDEDVQSMLAHQSADMMDDYDDSILLFDKGSDINLLSPRKDVGKSKKDAWSPKKEIWSAKNEKKRKLREASLSPAPEESNKKKVGTKDDEEQASPALPTKVCSKPDLGLESGSDMSRPGSSQQQVDSPDISCGSPIPGVDGEGRAHDPSTRRTSTPGVGARKTGGLLSTPQKLLRKQLEQELADLQPGPEEGGRESPTPTATPPFKLPSPKVSLPWELTIRFLKPVTEQLKHSFQADVQKLLMKYKDLQPSVVEQQQDQEQSKSRNKRLSEASNLTQSSGGGSSGYLGGSSSGITSSSDGSKGRSRLSIFPEEAVPRHKVIAKLPQPPRVQSVQDLVEGPEVAAEEVVGETATFPNVVEEELTVVAVSGGPNVAFVDDAASGVIESQTVMTENRVANTPEQVKKVRKKKETADIKVKEKPKKRLVKKRPLNKVKEGEVGKDTVEHKEVEEPTSTTSEAISDRFAVGKKVFAKWVDGTGVYFYPAEVVERVGEERVKVQYLEDQVVSATLATEVDVISAHILSPGDQVTVKHDMFQAYEVTASLLNYPTNTAKDVLFELAITATDSEPQPNEDSRTVGHREVSLTDSQACAILRGKGLVPTTNKVSADINFENLVFSERKRTTRTPSKSSEAQPSTPRRRRGGEQMEESATSGPATQGDSSTSTDQGGGTPAKMKKVLTPAKRGGKVAGKPQTPVIQRRKGRKMVSSDDEDEEVMPKSSSRMQAVVQARTLEDVKEEPPAKASPKTPARGRSKKSPDIFAGMTFVLTSSKQSLPMTEGESEDDFTDGESVSVAVPKFEKKKYRELITAHGGQVLAEYPSQSAPSPTLEREVVVVTDRHCLTMTYMLALADSVPIVSHMYIQDCVASSSVRDRRAYLLPAGFSSLLMKEVEQYQDCSQELRVNDCLLPVRGTRQRREEDPALSGRRILSGLHVLVISSTPDFTADWQSVLDSLGAAVTARHSPTARLDKLRLPDVVVTDSSAPGAVCKDLGCRSDIPVVSTKWIVQCAVNNARVAYNNFKYKLPQA